MLPDLDRRTTVLAFVAVIAIGAGAMLTMPIGMTTETVLTMVVPSMAVFGLVMLLIGVGHGQYRAAR